MQTMKAVKPTGRFLVVGCGSIGKRHIGNLLKLKADVIAFDIKEGPRRDVESKYGIRTLARLEEAWDLNPDIAFITAPTSLHIPLAQVAAEHGCHLFIEKPLSDSMEGVDRLLDTVKAKRLTTLVGCNLRFHPGLAKVKEVVESGGIGRVVAARAEVGQYLPDWHPWEDYRMGYSASRQMGGGIILDAIHEIDYVRWLVGEVESVACFAGKLSRLEIETEDTAGILLRLRGGAIGEIHMDYVQRAYSRSCRVIGDGGTIEWDYVGGSISQYSPEQRAWTSSANPPGWETNQMYLDETLHFLRCLEGEKPQLDIFEARRVLKIALAAKTSAETGKVISLGEWKG